MTYNPPLEKLLPPIRISEEMEARIKEYMGKDHRIKVDMVRVMLQDYIDKREANNARS